jgi:hypothetical protein
VEDGVTNVYRQDYNAENRLASVALVSGNCETPGDVLQSWVFTYDGDGNKVKQDYFDGTTNLTTLYFFGGAYEVRNPGSLDQSTLRCYAIAGMTVAMQDETILKFFLSDHLGSIVAVLDDAGAILSEQRYLPFGEVRADVGSITQTDFGYTFQRSLPDMGLMDYKAKWKNPSCMITKLNQRLGSTTRVNYC